jgi:hypothetical protein
MLMTKQIVAPEADQLVLVQGKNFKFYNPLKMLNNCFNSRCWLESSFVGTKPLESPQTPSENQFASSQPHKTINIGPMSVTATNYDSIRLNGIGGGESSVI